MFSFVLFAGFSTVDCALKNTNFSAMPIRCLRVKKGSGSSALMEMSGFSDAGPIDSIVDNFSFLSDDLHNDMFLDYWSKQKKKQSERMLTFAQVVEYIWEPTIEQCVQLLDGLKERSIPLQEVDSLLNRYSNRLENLENQLINLQKGICRVTGRPIPSERWISECVKRMKQYHFLHTHADAAEVFVTFRDKLGLLGDFSVVENLSRKVHGIYVLVFVICLHANFYLVFTFAAVCNICSR